jgi:hypothetical protein
MAFDISNLNVSSMEYRTGLENLNNRSSLISTNEGSGQALSLMGNIAQAFQGFTMMNDGAKMAMDGAKFQASVYRQSGVASKQGADFQAKVYRQAGAAAKVAANFNIALEEFQLARQQGAIGRQLDDVISENYARTASNGISMSSRSVMSVQNEVFSNAERNYTQIKNDTVQRQTLIDFQGKLAEMNYENEARAAEYSGLVAQQSAENQARAAEYQGKVDAYKARSQAAQSIGNSFSSMMQTLGG